MPVVIERHDARHGQRGDPKWRSARFPHGWWASAHWRGDLLARVGGRCGLADDDTKEDGAWAVRAVEDLHDVGVQQGGSGRAMARTGLR